MKLPKWLCGSDDYTVEVWPDKADLWRWRIIALDGQTVAPSGESYSSKANALQTASHVAKSAGWPLVVMEF